MTNIPIHAQVKCTDGNCGKSTNVIVNPVSHKVTHVVIEDKSLPDNPALSVDEFIQNLCYARRARFWIFVADCSFFFLLSALEMIRTGSINYPFPKNEFVERLRCQI